MSKKILIVIFGCFIISNAWAYRIKGSFQGVEKCWYPKVYLEVIDDITDHGFYSVNARNIIGETLIDQAGNFVLEGNDLPDAPMFYRLYVTPDKNASSLISTGKDRNYVVLLLTNASDIVVEAPQICSDYFEYTVSGSADCIALQQLQHLLGEFDRIPWDSMGDARKKFVNDRYLQSLFAFADSSSSLMAGLRAIAEMEPKENYTTHRAAYDNFARKFSTAYPASVYAKQLNDLIALEAFKQEPKKEKSGVSMLTVVLGVLLLCSVLLNLFLYKKSNKLKDQAAVDLNPREDEVHKIDALIQQLTIKEREILLLVHQGLSNKEIAEKLNVELSTVKTHISRIYQKINIKSRKEVSRIARHIPKSTGY